MNTHTDAYAQYLADRRSERQPPAEGRKLWHNLAALLLIIFMVSPVGMLLMAIGAICLMVYAIVFKGAMENWEPGGSTRRHLEG